MRRLLLVLLGIGLVGCATPAPIPDAAEPFARVAGSPPLLRAFLYEMPKGADLHTHLSGAAYAEGFIKAGAERGLCFTPASGQVAWPPCPKGTRPLADAVNDAGLTGQLVSAWSMRAFVPVSGYDGHDHFFASFAKFGGAAPPAAMAREVVNRAGAQRMRHIEPMITFQGGPVGALADKVQKQTSWTGDMAAFEAALLAGGLADLAKQGARDAAGLTAEMRKVQRCGTPAAEVGCAVNVRWLQQVTRTNPPWRVFAQTLFAALLQRESSDVGGLNFVAPEDHPVALRDYTLHMRMIEHVRSRHPDTGIALHAGELRLGLVPPEDLTFHIRQAVEIAGAHRIGHGVAVMHETDAVALLREMARRRVAVEINLTSNDQILEVDGPDHPFPLYRAAGVPTVISTDDEGVSRIDRTHELQRAVMTYGLTWADLVGLERASLEYAFLPGESLWADPMRWRMVAACAGATPAADPPPACAAHLSQHQKSRLQWSLERDLAAFSQRAAALTVP